MSWALGEQLGYAGFVKPRHVRPCAIEYALKIVSFAHKATALAEQDFVFRAQPVVILLDPSSVRLTELRGQIADEAASRRDVLMELPGVILGIER